MRAVGAYLIGAQQSFAGELQLAIRTKIHNEQPRYANAIAIDCPLPYLLMYRVHTAALVRPYKRFLAQAQPQCEA